MMTVFDGHIAAILPFLPRPLAGLAAQYAAYTELEKAEILERHGPIRIGTNVRMCLYMGGGSLWVYIEGGLPLWAYGRPALNRLDAPDFDVSDTINSMLGAMHATSVLRHEYMCVAAREVQKILTAGGAPDSSGPIDAPISLQNRSRQQGSRD